MKTTYLSNERPIFVKHPEFNLICDILFSFLERLHGYNQNKFYNETLPEIKSGNSLKALIKFVSETQY